MGEVDGYAGVVLRFSVTISYYLRLGVSVIQVGGTTEKQSALPLTKINKTSFQTRHMVNDKR
jgi:hypothetical protein